MRLEVFGGPCDGQTKIVSEDHLSIGRRVKLVYQAEEVEYLIQLSDQNVYYLRYSGLPPELERS